MNLVWLVALLGCVGLAFNPDVTPRGPRAASPRVDRSRPLQAYGDGHEIRLGMTRGDLLELLGPPPELYDGRDEMLWGTRDGVWRCFLRDGRVVAFQTSSLYQGSCRVLDHGVSRQDVLDALGAPRIHAREGEIERLVYRQGDQVVVVEFEQFVGWSVRYIGVAAPGFELEQFRFWCRPIPE